MKSKLLQRVLSGALALVFVAGALPLSAHAADTTATSSNFTPGVEAIPSDAKTLAMSNLEVSGTAVGSDCTVDSSNNITIVKSGDYLISNLSTATYSKTITIAASVTAKLYYKSNVTAATIVTNTNSVLELHGAGGTLCATEIKEETSSKDCSVLVSGGTVILQKNIAADNYFSNIFLSVKNAKLTVADIYASGAALYRPAGFVTIDLQNASLSAHDISAGKGTGDTTFTQGSQITAQPGSGGGDVTVTSEKSTLHCSNISPGMGVDCYNTGNTTVTATDSNVAVTGTVGGNFSNGYIYNNTTTLSANSTKVQVGTVVGRYLKTFFFGSSDASIDKTISGETGGNTSNEIKISGASSVKAGNLCNAYLSSEINTNGLLETSNLPDNVVKTKGIIIIGSSGQVYGSPTIDRTCTFSKDAVLTIPKDSTLTVEKTGSITGNDNAQLTLANSGTVKNHGYIAYKAGTNNGTVISDYTVHDMNDESYILDRDWQFTEGKDTYGSLVNNIKIINDQTPIRMGKMPTNFYVRQTDGSTPTLDEKAVIANWNPVQVYADWEAATGIIVTVLDQAKNPIVGATLNFTKDGQTVTEDGKPKARKTDQNGQYMLLCKDATADTVYKVSVVAAEDGINVAKDNISQELKVKANNPTYCTITLQADLGSLRIKRSSYYPDNTSGNRPLVVQSTDIQLRVKSATGNEIVKPISDFKDVTAEADGSLVIRNVRTHIGSVRAEDLTAPVGYRQGTSGDFVNLKKDAETSATIFNYGMDATVSGRTFSGSDDTSGLKDVKVDITCAENDKFSASSVSRTGGNYSMAQLNGGTYSLSAYRDGYYHYTGTPFTVTQPKQAVAVPNINLSEYQKDLIITKKDVITGANLPIAPKNVIVTYTFGGTAKTLDTSRITKDPTTPSNLLIKSLRALDADDCTFTITETGDSVESGRTAAKLVYKHIDRGESGTPTVELLAAPPSRNVAVTVTDTLRKKPVDNAHVVITKTTGGDIFHDAKYAEYTTENGLATLMYVPETTDTDSYTVTVTADGYVKASAPLEITASSDANPKLDIALTPDAGKVDVQAIGTDVQEPVQIAIKDYALKYAAGSDKAGEVVADTVAKISDDKKTVTIDGICQNDGPYYVDELQPPTGYGRAKPYQAVVTDDKLASSPIQISFSHDARLGDLTVTATAAGKPLPTGTEVNVVPVDDTASNSPSSTSNTASATSSAASTASTVSAVVPLRQSDGTSADTANTKLPAAESKKGVHEAHYALAQTDKNGQHTFQNLYAGKYNVSATGYDGVTTVEVTEEGANAALTANKSSGGSTSSTGGGSTSSTGGGSTSSTGGGSTSSTGGGSTSSAGGGSTSSTGGGSTSSTGGGSTSSTGGGTTSSAKGTITVSGSYLIFKDANGKPVAGLQVTLRKDSPTGRIVLTGKTDSSGRLSVAGLAAGKYYIHGNGIPAGAYVTLTTINAENENGTTVTSTRTVNDNGAGTGTDGKVPQTGDSPVLPTVLIVCGVGTATLLVILCRRRMRAAAGDDDEA